MVTYSEKAAKIAKQKPTGNEVKYCAVCEAKGYTCLDCQRSGNVDWLSYTQEDRRKSHEGFDGEERRQEYRYARPDSVESVLEKNDRTDGEERRQASIGKDCVACGARDDGDEHGFCVDCSQLNGMESEVV